MVQWLKLCASTAGAWLQSPAEEPDPACHAVQSLATEGPEDGLKGPLSLAHRDLKVGLRGEFLRTSLLTSTLDFDLSTKGAVCARL